MPILLTDKQFRFQSTPPRGGRQDFQFVTADGQDVSIHAPARGATLGEGLVQSSESVSIHAPARGATCLNSLAAILPLVSIHAPARGATRYYPGNKIYDQFQSTPPRGGRPCSVLDHVVDWCFNPRPRAGGDLRAYNNVQDLTRVSIHAPARGATDAIANCCCNMLFQSTPPRGGRLFFAAIIGTPVSFNPRPRAGGDTGNKRMIKPSAVSIHAPARGATGTIWHIHLQ